MDSTPAQNTVWSFDTKHHSFFEWDIDRAADQVIMYGRLVFNSGPFQWITNVTLQSVAFAGVVLLLVAGAFFYFQRQLNSPFGRLLKSIRDDDVASRTLGKNIIRTKVEVMVIGSAFAGIAGALFTYYSNYVNPDNFIPVVTFNVWVMIVLGGLGNNKGALLGTIIVTILQKALEIMSITVPIANASLVLNYLTYVIEGVVFILLLVYRPQGLLKEEPVKTPAGQVIKKGGGGGLPEPG